MPFFITGLPRSRTAWLANLFCHGSDSFCYHDRIKDSVTPGQLLADLNETNGYFSNVGDSDSALLLYAKTIQQASPHARWVFVKRDWQEAARSFHEYFKGSYPGSPKTFLDTWSVFEHAEKCYENAITGSNHIEVSYESLDNLDVVRQVWEFVLPYVRFPEERVKLLDTFRVNVIPSKLTFAEKFFSE